MVIHMTSLACLHTGLSHVGHQSKYFEPFSIHYKQIIILMFYVPDDESSSKKKASLRIIKRFSQLYERINPERRDNHSTIRLKTVDAVIEKQKRNSLPCKPKRSNLCLPIIEEKKFLLKGSELSPSKERSESTRKLATKYQKKLKNFKKAEKQNHQNKTVHKMRISFGNMGVHVQPWIVSQQSPYF